MEIKLLPKLYPMLSQSRTVHTLFSDQWSKLPLPQRRLVIVCSSFLYLSSLAVTLHYFHAVSTWSCHQMTESPDMNNSSHYCKGKSVLQVCCKRSWINCSLVSNFFSCTPQRSQCIKLHTGFVYTLVTIAQNPPLFFFFFKLRSQWGKPAIYFHSG